MLTHTFRYYHPIDIEEAFTLLQEPESVALAGGTDLLVHLREARLQPNSIVDLKGCRELAAIERRGDDLWIGACVTINSIVASPLIKSLFPLLTEAGERFACYELRNRATIGGNLANAAPCAQFAPPALVTDALLEIGSAAGVRQIHVSDFFHGVNQTDLQRGELILGIRFPIPREPYVCASAKLSRTRGMDLPSATLSMLILRPHEPAQREVRLAVGAVAPSPIRLPSVEKELSGKHITPRVLEEARALIRQEIRPRASSLRAAPETKRTVLGFMVGDILRRFGLVEEEERT